MFQGHKFIKLINNTWVLDLTESKGYKVKIKPDGDVDSYKEAFTAVLEGNEVSFNKNIRIPLKVLKEAAVQIFEYYENLEEPAYE